MTSRTDGATVGLSCSGIIRPGPECMDPLSSILRSLLETGAVDSVLTTARTPQPGRFVYSLISDPERLELALPFLPVMPVQGAKALSELTREESPGKLVAVLLRPCELRAFVENVKQAQGSFENLLVISCTCPGVIPAEYLRRKNRESVLERYRASVAEGEIPEDVRSMCSCCSRSVPGRGADMTVVIAAVSEGSPAGTVYLHSDIAVELASGLEHCTIEQHQHIPDLTDAQTRGRKEKLGRLVSCNGGLPEGLSSLLEVFSACIGCRACREVCPLCHCVVCDYETDRTRWSPEKISKQARARGALRVPSGTIQFHLGRLMHISASCVSCGQCSDACPADIPVAEIFARAGRLVQNTLGYSPGEDPDGKPPMATFEVRELEEITG